MVYKNSTHVKADTPSVNKEESKKASYSRYLVYNQKQASMINLEI